MFGSCFRTLAVILFQILLLFVFGLINLKARDNGLRTVFMDRDYTEVRTESTRVS